jgi:hypothetical protein
MYIMKYENVDINQLAFIKLKSFSNIISNKHTMQEMN